MAANARVLVIDDYPQILRFIRLALQSRGYRVTTVGSGEEGLEKLESEPPDVILLDIRMPDMDGFEFMARAKELNDRPVIAYSATPEFAGRALKNGARAFLRKPLDLDQLVELLEELTAG